VPAVAENLAINQLFNTLARFNRNKKNIIIDADSIVFVLLSKTEKILFVYIPFSIFEEEIFSIKGFIKKIGTTSPSAVMNIKTKSK
tara:strand:+ start:233 stop:490 length:258 start_codon:yes stop_codon:yes gene_type:complete